MTTQQADDMTDLRRRSIPTPKFGATVTNHFASEDNPTRVGIFVRSGRRNGRMNPGVWWELTDGRGKFWQVSPDAHHLLRQEDFPHLTVDRTTETPAVDSERAEGEKRWNNAVDWLLNSRHTGDPDIQTPFWQHVDGEITLDELRAT